MNHQIRGTHLKIILDATEFKDGNTKKVFPSIFEKIAICEKWAECKREELYTMVRDDKIIAPEFLEKLKKQGVKVPDLNLKAPVSTPPGAGSFNTSNSMEASLTTMTKQEYEEYKKNKKDNN